MTTRIVRQGVDDLEPQLPIELRRLEAVGGEDNLKTPPAAGFPLRQFEKTSTHTLAAMLFIHPNLANLTAPAPGMPAEPRDKLAPGIATRHRQS